MSTTKTFCVVMRISAWYDYQYYVKAPTKELAYKYLAEEKWKTGDFINDEIHDEAFGDDFTFVECREVSDQP